jgi:predicted ATPase
VARAYLELSLPLHEAQRLHSQVRIHGGMETEVFILCNMAGVIEYLGYLDQALQKSKLACHLAQERSHLLSLSGAHIVTAMWHQLRRDLPLTHECIAAGLSLALEHGFPNWVAHANIMWGWILAQQGEIEEGMTQIYQGLAAQRTLGVNMFQSYFLVLLAETHGKAGQVEAGLSTLAEALAVIEKTDERFYEAELYRLKGELTLQQASKEQGAKSREQDAEADFLKAIAIARKQEAKSLELRAVMSLVRLRQRQAKDHATRNTQHESRSTLAEAHQLLSAIYTWFTEGFDAKDLQEAKALLEALRP